MISCLQGLSKYLLESKQCRAREWSVCVVGQEMWPQRAHRNNWVIKNALWGAGISFYYYHIPQKKLRLMERLTENVTTATKVDPLSESMEVRSRFFQCVLILRSYSQCRSPSLLEVGKVRCAFKLIHYNGILKQQQALATVHNLHPVCCFKCAGLS